MRTKAQVALTALEQALKITGIQEPRRDDEFTAQEYAKSIKRSENQARRILGLHIAQGTFIVRKTGKGYLYSIA